MKFKVKACALVFLISLFSLDCFSQRSYTDPREREKRPLLEEPIEEVENDIHAVGSEAESGVTSTLTKGQIKYCACQKVYFLSLKRESLRTRLTSKGYIKYDSDQRHEFKRHMRKANDAMKLIRGKYEIDEDFECHQEGLSFKKISHYTKAIRSLVSQCDVDIITESI